ncbi:MAG: hypothetical protein AAB174_01120, partial [Pseudomonadota bacterium]
VLQSVSWNVPAGVTAEVTDDFRKYGQKNAATDLAYTSLVKMRTEFSPALKVTKEAAHPLKNGPYRTCGMFLIY